MRRCQGMNLLKFYFQLRQTANSVARYSVHKILKTRPHRPSHFFLKACLHIRVLSRNSMQFLSRPELHQVLKELRHRSCILKKIAKLFKIVISNPFQSSPFSAILVPFCSRFTHVVSFFLSKPLVLGFATL